MNPVFAKVWIKETYVNKFITLLMITKDKMDVCKLAVAILTNMD